MHGRPMLNVMSSPSEFKPPVQHYRLARRYAVTSLIAVAITALMIFFFFRYETTSIVEAASIRSNETLTIATEYALNDHFVMFLNIIKQNEERNISKMPFEPLLHRVIERMLNDTDVMRIKLYDLSGRVVYSTDPDYNEDDEEHNEAFDSAVSGEPASSLIYDDRLSLFTSVGEKNLVQTYVPIRATRDSPVLGVMEIYSDIGYYALEANRTILILLVITLTLMTFLYFFLLIHIKRSERIIEDQHRETQEKKRLLEYLTSKMITAQEDEKKRIAFELHEDVVQTLSGAKMQLERYLIDLDRITADDEISQLSQNIVPVLQEAAHKIRAVAIDLRPPSLDDFGLKAALNSLVSECHTITKGLEIQVNLEVEEVSVSHDQKSILYRILKDTMKGICFDEQMNGSASFSLIREEDRLILQVQIESEAIRSRYRQVLPGFFESMQERTILSGGEFIVRQQKDERLWVESVWFS
ncbi:MAG: histidine kinase [Candidatus Thiodiazotropha sp.]